MKENDLKGLLDAGSMVWKQKLDKTKEALEVAVGALENIESLDNDAERWKIVVAQEVAYEALVKIKEIQE